MTDLYDELGVARDATPEDIKKAYRRKSRKHHPDRGGDTAKMSKVNVAYAVLSDPMRRSRYDQTGDESNGMSSVEAKAKNLIYAIMSDVLNNVTPGRAQIIEQMRQHIKKECGKMKTHITQANAAIKRLEQHRTRLHDDGLFKNLFDAKEAEIKRSIGEATQNLEVANRAIEMLKDCSYDYDNPPQFFTTSTVTSTGSF